MVCYTHAQDCQDNADKEKPNDLANGDDHWVPGDDDDELEEVGDEQPQHNGHVSAAAKPRRKKPRGKGKGKGGGRRRRRKRGKKPSAQQQRHGIDPDRPPPRRRKPRRPNETAAQMHAWAMDKSPAEERVHFMRFGSSPLSSPSAYSPTGTPLSQQLTPALNSKRPAMFLSL